MAAADPGAARADGFWREQWWLSRIIYWGIHAACALVLVTGVSTADLVLCFSLFFGRMFFITGGYHRYFAHKTYKTSRAFQFVLAFLGCTAVQKGPLWWAAAHRRHHQYTDVPGDVHSPNQGFWYAHQGWIFSGEWDDTDVERIPDFARFPELAWLNRWHIVPPALLALACFAFGGLSGVVWGFAVSTVLLWHTTYSINSLAHLWGSRRYDTGDTSRNNPLLAVLTMGEGWHNNHHHYMASTRQGFFWWEIDATYYLLRALAAVGLVWAIREPPEQVVRPAARLDRAA